MKKTTILTATVLVLFCKTLMAQIGIGTSNPDPSAILHVESNNKGVLLPKVSLQTFTDNTTIINPANGLTVFNTSSLLNGQGIYINMGTPASPQWQKTDLNNNSLNETVKRLIYNGTTTDPAKVLVTEYYEWRMVSVDATTYAVQARLRNTPLTTVNISGHTILWQTTTTTKLINTSWTISDWNTWKDIYTYTSNWDSMMFLTASNDLTKFYKLGAHVVINDYNLLALEIF
jgi:hypothetical protein